MTDERLRRFFTRESDHYRVTRELRDIVLFARHSLLKDPPFSRADLISCRNVLIYLDRKLQQQVCATFHFALKPHGYLFLGSSESADASGRHVPRRSTARRASTSALPIANEIRMTPRIGPPSFGARAAAGANAARPLPRGERGGVHREALERFAPPSVVVDESYRVVHLSEHAGRYLQPSGGTLVNDITELAREELRFDLRAALHRAFARNEPSLSGPIAVRFNGARATRLSAGEAAQRRPQRGPVGDRLLLRGRGARRAARAAPARSRSSAPVEQIQQLQQELQFTQSQLRDLARGIRGRQRGAARGQRGAAVDQRGVPLDRGGAGDQQGGAAVDQRGAADRQQRAEGEARKRVARPQRHPEPDGGDRRRHPVSRHAIAHQPLHAAHRRAVQHRRRRRRPVDHRLHPQPRLRRPRQRRAHGLARSRLQRNARCAAAAAAGI